MCVEISTQISFHRLSTFGVVCRMLLGMYSQRIATIKQYAQDDSHIWHTLIEWGLVLIGIPSSNTSQLDEAVILFTVDTVYYAIPSSQIRDVCVLGSYVPLPFVHRCIVGVVYHQGQPLPVLDIRSLIGASPITPHCAGKILVLQLNELAVGLLTDDIVDTSS